MLADTQLDENDVLFEELIRIVREFDAALPDNMQTGFISGGIHYRLYRITRFRKAQLLVLSGGLPSGEPFQLVQPLVPPNLSLIGMPQEGQGPRPQIGFHTKDN